MLDFQNHAYVMGILNCTSDSFYPGSRVPGTEQALQQARRMISAGAEILDVGGESTRPGSESVSLDVELERTIPIIQKISRELNIPISIDTSKHEVARQALKAGASIVNDVSIFKIL